MAVGDRKLNPPYDGYAVHEVTDETVIGGARQAAMLVKIVGDDGSTSSPATSAKQDTGNTSLASIDTKLSTLLTQTDGMEASLALLEPAARCAAVTPDDGADLASNTRALMVSVAGDVVVDFVTTGASVTLTGLQPGIAYPFRVKRVRATGTTATGILALW